MFTVMKVADRGMSNSDGEFCVTQDAGSTDEVKSSSLHLIFGNSVLSMSE